MKTFVLLLLGSVLSSFGQGIGFDFQNLPPGALPGGFLTLEVNGVTAFFGASDSKYVNQEIGGSVVMGKTLVPILCGISSEELPGWAKGFQAVELTDDRGPVRKMLDFIAEDLRVYRFWTAVVLVAFLGFILWLLTKED